MDRLIKITATFIDSNTNQPMTGEEYSVKLFDEDPLLDDFLGKGTLDKNGKTEIIFNLSKIDSIDSPGEKKPDLYLILYKNDDPKFRSKVFRNVNLIQGTADNDPDMVIEKDLGVFKLASCRE